MDTRTLLVLCIGGAFAYLARNDEGMAAAVVAGAAVVAVLNKLTRR